MANENIMILNLTDNLLTINLEWYEQLWAFTPTNQFRIPLAHIVSASTDEPQSTWAEIRAPGTFLPGIIKAGTYYTRQGKEFWYVTQDSHYLILNLAHEPYQRMIFTLNENLNWAENINNQITNNV
jgi:hypothetical protein